jgi:hypothetical protein
MLTSLRRRPMDGRIVGIAATPRPVDGVPVDFGEQDADRDILDFENVGAAKFVDADRTGHRNWTFTLAEV